MFRDCCHGNGHRNVKNSFFNRPKTFARIMSLSIAPSASSSQEETGGSRLTPFKKLPRIGKSHEYVPRPPASQPPTTVSFRARHVSIQPSIVVAIRLSDGRRLEHAFAPSDRIKDIVRFVISQQPELGDEIYLSSGDVPKRQFKDFNLTLHQANIATRTVLFVDRP